MSLLNATVEHNLSFSKPLTLLLGTIALLSTVAFFIGQFVFLTSSLNVLSETYVVGGWLSVAFMVGMFLNIIAAMIRANTVSRLLFGIALAGIFAGHIILYTHVFLGGPFLFYPIFPPHIFPPTPRIILGTSWAVISLCMLAGGITFLRQRPLRWGNYFPLGIGIVFLSYFFAGYIFATIWTLQASLPIDVVYNLGNILLLLPFLLLNALLSIALMQSSRKETA